MKHRPPEEALHLACVDYLKWQVATGVVDGFHHSPNQSSGPVQWLRKRKALGTAAGFPDLLVYLPGGAILHAELKAGRNTLSPDQKTWRERCERLGLPWVEVRDVTDLQAAINRVRLS